jgi:hypothetical protein
MNNDVFTSAGKELAEAGIDLFGLVLTVTQCGNCDKVAPLNEVVISTFHITESLTEQEHFCCPKCAEEWWNSFRAKDD